MFPGLLPSSLACLLFSLRWCLLMQCSLSSKVPNTLQSLRRCINYTDRTWECIINGKTHCGLGTRYHSHGPYHSGLHQPSQWPSSWFAITYKSHWITTRWFPAPFPAHSTESHSFPSPNHTSASGHLAGRTYNLKDSFPCLIYDMIDDLLIYNRQSWILWCLDSVCY